MPDGEADNSSNRSELERIVESAHRLGVEMDEVEALQWLTAIALAKESTGVQVDVDSGVYGHRVTMLDFSADDIEYFRRVGEIVGLPDTPNVETALALSGSAAQSKVQTYPGDCDYFERVNIKATTQEEACAVLADVMRSKALATLGGNGTYRLIEVKLGSYPTDVTRDGAAHGAGSPIGWKPADIERGAIEVTDAGGAELTLHWEEMAEDPGWCKLDWVVADPVRDQVANASNMLDVTWEAPDGSITPLDGYLDPYFQEVYLEAESIPLFTKLARQVSPDALAEYVDQLEGEVRKYASKAPYNYGKAAKRMYNIFRLNGRYEEAAYLRELFDEPTAVLYQVAAVVRTLEEAAEPGSEIDIRAVTSQLDSLVIDAVRSLEGPDEEAIVRHLLRLRDALTDPEEHAERSDAAEAARFELVELVNTFFHSKLTGHPGIAAYLVEVAK